MNNSPVFKINLKKLVKNYNKISQIVGPCSAVIKCNAYGFGALETSKALLNGSMCRDFYVSNIEEALEIRSLSDSINIYLLSSFNIDELEIAWDNNLIPVCFTKQQVEFWTQKCESTFKRKSIVVQIETGLNRLGMSLEDFNEIQKYNPKIKFVMHHLACGYDVNNDMNKKQLQVISQIKGFSKTLSSSCGVLLDKEHHGDLVRLGRFLYGSNENTVNYNEKNGSDNYSFKKNDLNINGVKIEVVGTLTANIISTKLVKKDEYIGYSNDYIATKDMEIAVVNIGYGDGYSIRNGYVFTNGHYAKIISLAMDYLTIDITGIEIKNPEVELLGENITFEKISKWNYPVKGFEVTTSLGSRVKKVYS